MDFFVAPKPAPSPADSAPSPADSGPKSQTKKLVQTQNHKSSQNNIFLAIFLASKRMPRSNKPIYTKIQQILEILQIQK